jgi:hypothetical protein
VLSISIIRDILRFLPWIESGCSDVRSKANNVDTSTEYMMENGNLLLYNAVRTPFGMMHEELVEQLPKSSQILQR